MKSRADYYKYLASREWTNLKEKVRRRSGGKCERCHAASHEITHRLTYERFGNERLEDLLGVCEACHLFLTGSSNHDPQRHLSDLILIPLYVFGVSWIEYWDWTFTIPDDADSRTRADSKILTAALDAVALKVNPVLLRAETFFGVVPMSDYPAMCLWAGRSMNYLERKDLDIQAMGGLVATFEKFSWLSKKSWLFYVSLGSGEDRRLIAEADLSEQERSWINSFTDSTQPPQ